MLYIFNSLIDDVIENRKKHHRSAVANTNVNKFAATRWKPLDVDVRQMHKLMNGSVDNVDEFVKVRCQTYGRVVKV